MFLPVFYKILISHGIAQFGILLALLSLGAITSAYATGRLADSISPSKILSLVLVAQALIVLSYAGNWNIWVFYILQMAYGLLNVAVFTLFQSTVSKHSHGKEGRGTGTLSAFNQLSIGMGTMTGGFLAPLIGEVAIISIVSVLLYGMGIYIFIKR